MSSCFRRGYLKGFAISFNTQNLHQITSLKDLALTGSTFKFSLFDADYKLLFIVYSFVYFFAFGEAIWSTTQHVVHWGEGREQGGAVV